MNLGELVKIPEAICREYNVESYGFAGTVIDNGRECTRVTAGLLDSFPNANEPPELDYGNIFMDWIENFKADNFELADEAAKKCFDYELKLDKHIENDQMSGSETNVEYCFLADKDNGLMDQSEGKINLLNPSTGTMSRFVSTGAISQVEDVYIIGSPPEDYLARINGILSEYDKKFVRISPKKLNKDKFYYLSFNGHYGKKYRLKKYVGYFPNYYQMVQNGLCDAIYYNTFGVAVTYHRKGVEMVSSQSYADTHTNIYGSDALVHKYRSRKQYDDRFSIMHDIYSSYNLPFAVPVRSGRNNLTNCMVLIGNYSHKNKKIYDKDGNVVYTNTGKVHSCQKLSELWTPCDGEGRNLQRASYAINMFSSICIYLGKKYVCKNASAEFDIKYESEVFKEDGGGEKVFLCQENGKGIHNNGDKVEKLGRIVQAVQLHQYFVDQKYSYGTYHDMVYDCYDVGEKYTLEDLISKTESSSEGDTFYAKLHAMLATGEEWSVDKRNLKNKDEVG